MKTFDVDTNNDLHAENGLLVVASGLDCISQQCTQAMKTVRGECIFAADVGLPYMETVWTGSPNLLAFDAAARAALLAVPGVLFVTAFSARINNNVLQYSAELLTTAGTVSING